jgi:hypothetical protein
MKTLLTALILSLGIGMYAQQIDVPVQINLKNGESFNAKHFGQLKCDKNTYLDSYILIRGKYLGSVTEIKEYKDIEKIVLSGYSAEPVSSVGNEKGNVIIYKKNGVSVELDETEIIMSCYGVGHLYNQLIVQLENPLTGKVNEKKVDTKDIQSIIFR